MSEQLWSKLYKTLSVEVALIYAAFYRLVINGNGSLTDVSEYLVKLGISRNPSAIKRLMKELNLATKETSETDAFSKAKDQPYKTDDKFAPSLYAMCAGIEQAARNWKTETDGFISHPTINVGAIGFSLPYLEYLRRQIPSHFQHKLSFQFNVSTFRTRQIPDALRQDPQLNYVVGENSHRDLSKDSDTLRNSDSTDDLESKVIGEEELYIICSRDLGMRYFIDSEGRKLVAKEKLQDFRYITSHKSILQYYIGLETGIFTPSIDRKNEDLFNILRNDGIQFRDQIEPTIGSMIDAFFLSRKECTIIGGENLLNQMRARSVYLKQFYTVERDLEIHEIDEAQIEGRPFMQRRIFRRKNDAFSQSPTSIQAGIWQAAEKIHQGIHVNKEKLSCKRLGSADSHNSI